MVREVDQTANDENKEQVEIEIVMEDAGNHIHENYSIILAESDDMD